MLVIVVCLVAFLLFCLIMTACLDRIVADIKRGKYRSALRSFASLAIALGGAVVILSLKK
jgi:hypothetical protein